MNNYLIFKAIHILAVVAFLGNITTGLFWMRLARKTNDVGIIQHTVSGVIVSDKFFTIPGVIIITAFGIGAAIFAGYPLLCTGWIFWPLILFTLSGIFFAFKVVPLQLKMKRYLQELSVNVPFEINFFNRIFRQWEFWGLLALITPVLSFFLMILKWPSFSPFS